MQSQIACKIHYLLPAGFGSLFYRIKKSCVFDRGKCADLCDPVDAKVVANFVETLNDLAVSYGIGDTLSCHAIRFGKSAKANDVRVAGIDDRCNIIESEFDIGLVECQNRVFRHGIDH